MEKLKLAKSIYSRFINELKKDIYIPHIDVMQNTVNKAKVELLKMCDDQGVYKIPPRSIILEYTIRLASG
jgi:hypothetical protein